MRSLYWSLVHKLPWFIHRRLCDLCAEAGLSPREFDRILCATEPTRGPLGCQHLTVSHSVIRGACSICGELRPAPVTVTSGATVQRTINYEES